MARLAEGQEEVLDQPESPVGSPDRQERPVDAPSKGRRDTLIDMADEEGEDITFEELQDLMKNPQ